MKIKIFLCALIFMLHCGNNCNGERVAVSFETLFAPSAFKHVLYAYMNMWNTLKFADLSGCERLQLETAIVNHLMQMHVRNRGLKAHGANLDPKDAYLFALLLNIHFTQVQRRHY